MPVQQDYYQILGLSRDAGPDDIKSAYRRLAREYHPDVNRNNPQAEDRFKEINEAYEVLSDPDKRRRYDTYGHEAVNGNSGAGAGYGRDAFDTLFDLFFDATGGRGPSTRSSVVEGQDRRADVHLTLEEVMTGAEKTIDVVREGSCDACEGTGAKPGTGTQACVRCGGQGQIRHTQSTFLGSFSSVRPCPHCGGAGEVILNPCVACHGSGRQRKKEKVTVEVPAGVENGMQMRLANQGDAGMRGGRPGDLYVALHVRPHERFERRGADLAREWEIGFAQAALGTVVEIDTLDGSASLKIPPGTQSGTVVTLRGSGLPRLTGGGIGDLLVAIRVVTPTQLTEEQRQLFELLARLERDDDADDSDGADRAGESPRAGLFGRIKDFLTGA